MTLRDTFTSTGAKFFAHQEVMRKLQNGEGQPITTHVMLTDVCNHSCAFCSVQKRAGDSLSFHVVMSYISTLHQYGLKSVILSGGGNPILYRCKYTGMTINDVVNAIHAAGLEIGLITNGMPLRNYQCTWRGHHTVRESWGTVHPDTLDKITWIRISMAGLDHRESEVYVPDIDPTKTALGFSYVAHDIYHEPKDPYHGKVSTRADLLSVDKAPDWTFEERADTLTQRIGKYVEVYHPRYVRLLPNCLEPELIQSRCDRLQKMAEAIDPNIVFVQHKPPKAPHACYLGYIHPVLNCDGYVYPCDSCVLNEAADHTFANPWRVCHWTEVGRVLYEEPVHSLIRDPARTCPGCVFTRSNELLEDVVEGADTAFPPTTTTLEHVNFV